MSKILHLLQQVRNVTSIVLRTTDNAEHKALLSAVDVTLNELMLRDSAPFYLQYIARGKALLAEGLKLQGEQGSCVERSGTLRDNAQCDISAQVIDAEIQTLHQSILEVVNALDESRSSKVKLYFRQLADWEGSLYSHHLSHVGDLRDTRATQITRDSLQEYLHRKFPNWADLEVTSFTALDGGFSKKTILFETQDTLNGRQAMVIRAEQAVDILCYEGSDIVQEFHMIQLMRKAGVATAEPLWIETDATQLGARFIVSRKVTGNTLGGILGSKDVLPPELIQSIIATLIHMHNIIIDPNDPLARKSHISEWLPFASSLHETTNYYVTVFIPRIIALTGIPASPQLARALRWLKNNIPDSDESPVVAHIDFALNNLIIEDNKIAAVLDWESSRLGDPADDIIHTQRNLSEYISMDDFLKQYTTGTGRAVSEYRMVYSKVAKCALNAIVCLNSIRLMEENPNAHVSLAILGYKYLAIFGAQFDSLIEEAEALNKH
jgi:aminoglycoside phosphotransferase (APT) family kinase protein